MTSITRQNRVTGVIKGQGDSLDEIPGGCTGHYLEIDLTEGTTRRYPVPPEWYRTLVGGKGIGSRILSDTTEPGVEPLGPENTLVFNTGPFTGSGAPCSSRFNVSTKSPLTGGIASSSCGGSFGHHLKRAGFDGVVFRGRSPSPVRVHLEGGEARITDASDLWGLNTAETQERLAGDAAAVIGPAGENGVLFASIISGERAAGRCGVGAVMGSKNLKALTVSGGPKRPVAHPEQFKKGVRRLTDNLTSHPVTGKDGTLHRLGTGMLFSMTNVTNTLPTRNFSRGSFEDADLVCGEAVAETILERTSGCLSCPIRCGRVVRHRGGLAKGAEYETLAMFGPNLEVSDLDAIVEWNRICDLMGMDTISTAVTVGFAMELAERGMLDSPLRFGSTDHVSETLTDIAMRRGPGEDLSLGTWRLSEKYGGEEFAAQSRGQELAAYEPRGAIGHGLGYALSNRGACHINGGGLVYLEALTAFTIDPLAVRSKPELVAIAQAMGDAWATLGLCMFLMFGLLPGEDLAFPPYGFAAGLMSKVVLASGPMLRLVLNRPRLLNAVPLPFDMLPYIELLNALTGFEFRLGDFLELGLRVNNLERLFNVREGRGMSGDTLPARLTSIPQTDDPDSLVPLDDLLPASYKVRGWDSHGRPTGKTLKRLGLA